MKSFGGLGAFFLLSCFLSNAELREVSARPRSKVPVASSVSMRALLVGVANPAPGSGWWHLHADRDLELMRESLRRHGFAPEGVAELRDREATAEGIAAAFERRLIAPAKAGDVAVFYYSGHGQRLTDDDGDEVDGYDEALAPYGAPREPTASYRGERHLRDDRLGLLITRLRARLGGRGNVLVILDTCFSGTATRGVLAVRGSAPIGSPRVVGGGGADAASGFRDAGGSNASGSEAHGLAPLIVLSASRSDEPAYETSTSDRGAVGTLTWAVARALSSPGLALSYRGLFEEARRELGASFMGQEIQAEGDLDTALFSGRAVPQEPFVEVSEVLSGGRGIVVRPGELLGLTVGSEVEIHRAGASGAEAATRLALGRIITSEPTSAEVKLSEIVSPIDLRGARIFMTARDFGDLRLRVRLKGRASQPLLKALEETAAIELADRDADLEVVLAAGGQGASELVSINDLDTGARLVGPGELRTERLVVALPHRLEDLARNRYLRKIQLEDPEFPINLEIVPVTLEHCSEGSPKSLQSCTVVPAAREGYLAQGGPLELPVGTYFQVRITPGPRPAYVAVIGLVSDGSIAIFWPMPGAEEPIVSQDRAPRVLPALYRASAPLGLDALLVVASEEFLDFQPLRSSSEIEPRGPLKLRGPFATLFDERRIRERGRAVFAPRSVTTSLEVVRIGPAKR